MEFDPSKQCMDYVDLNLDNPLLGYHIYKLFRGLFDLVPKEYHQQVMILYKDEEGSGTGYPTNEN